MSPLTIMTTSVSGTFQDSGPSYPSLGWQLTSMLGEDRCDTGHPTLPDTWCSLRVGHGGPHQCCALQGEGHEWGTSRTVDPRTFSGLSPMTG